MAETFEQVTGRLVGSRPEQEKVSYGDLAGEANHRVLFRSGVNEVINNHPLMSGDSIIEDDEEKARMANSVFIAKTYGITVKNAMTNHDGVISQLFGENVKPSVAFKKIQGLYKTDKEKFDEYHANTPWQQETKDWLAGQWSQAKLSVAGIVEADTDISGAIQEKVFGRKTAINRRLNEWSSAMREGVYQDMQAHPEQFLRPPGNGFWDTTAGYIKHPEYIAWGVAEQVPLIIASLVSGGTAGAVAKGVGATAKVVKTAAWLGRVEGFATPLFGQRYADLRQQGISPIRALPEAFLASQSEALLEEWVLSKKLSIFKAAGSQAKRGIGEVVAKHLLGRPVLRRAYGVATAYGRGAVEEGSQQISDNFWGIVFRDLDVSLFDGAAQAAAAGGILELSMTGVFRAGAKLKGVKTVSLDEQLARVEIVRDFVNESPLSQIQKKELNQEIDSVREGVENGKFVQPTEAVTPEKEVAEEEKVTQPQNIIDEIQATPRYGIQESEGKWVVKDWETQREVSVHASDRQAIKEMNKLNTGVLQVEKERKAPLLPSEKTVTIRQALQAVMKGVSKAAQTAYMQGARDTIRGTTNLGKYANEILGKLDITAGQRKTLINAVSKPRTPAQQIVAMATIKRLADITKHAAAVKNLKKTLAYINRRIGVRMQEGGIRPEYFERIRDITEGFLVKKIRPKLRKRLESLKNFLEGVKTQGLSQYEEDYIEARIPQKLLDQIPKLAVKNVDSMTSEEIEQVNNMLNELVALNKLKNRLIGQHVAGEVAETLNASMEEVNSVVDKSKKDANIKLNDDPNAKGILKNMFNFFAGNKNHNVETLAETISGTVGTVHDVLANGMSDGRQVQYEFENEWDDIVTRNLSKANIELDDLQGMSNLFFQVINSPKIREFLAKQGVTLKQAKTFPVSIAGNAKTLTMAEALSVYMHARAVDFNLREILKSGIADKHKILGKITVEEIGKIVDIISKDKKALAMVDMADELHDFARKRINETSRLLDGRDIATVDTYWHVRRFKTGGVAGRQTFRNSLLESLGLLKERTGGKNPIVITDFFESLAYEQQAVAEYVGMARPYRNIKNLLNYKPFRQTLQVKGYKEELGLIDVLIERAEQKPRAYSATDPVIGKILRGLTRSVLANPGIMAGQYASVVGYFTEVDTKYISELKGLAKKEESDRYKRILPMYRRRVEGGVSSIATQDLAEGDTVLRAFTNRTAAINVLTRGIHFVDSIAITEAVRLAEAEMADKNQKGLTLEYWERVGIVPSSLEKDSAEYIDALNKRFNYIVRRTQPMFTTENRSILTSAETGIEKSLFLFRSYIDQPMRMVYRAYNLYANGKTGKETMIKQIATVWTGLAFYEIVRMAVKKGLVRSDDDDEKDLLLKIGIAPIKTLNLVGYPAQQLLSNLFAQSREKPKRFQTPNLSPLPLQFINDLLRNTSLITKGLSFSGSKERFQSGKRKGQLKSNAFMKEGIEGLAKDSLRYMGVPVRVIEDIIKEEED